MASKAPTGKPKYIPGESMTSYNARVAQWLKVQSSEKGTQASYTSKVKSADTGTHSSVKIGESDSGSYESTPQAGSAETGTHYAGQGGYEQQQQQGGNYEQGY